jgi:hypothetical protein
MNVQVALSHWSNGLPRWDVDKERGSLPDFAFNGNISAMLLDDLVRDRKSQTAPLVFAGKKRIEYVFEILVRDTDASIPDFNLYK